MNKVNECLLYIGRQATNVHILTKEASVLVLGGLVMVLGCETFLIYSRFCR